jgi:hypothetical protein
MVLTVFNLVGDPPGRVIESAILAFLAFLVFWTIGVRRGGDVQASLDTVLRNRESYRGFDELLDGANELWLYAPTGVNVMLRYAAGIRQWVAKRARARVVLQDPSAVTVDAVRAQHDPHTDFDTSLTASLATLSKLASSHGVDFRLLPFNPGFSLVVVDPNERGGRLIVEFHEFCDASISERRHVDIRRSQPESTDAGFGER